MNSYDLRFDHVGLRQILSTLEDFTHSSPELAQLLFRLPESFNEIFVPEYDATARAGELVIRLKPTDRLLELCPALRAGDGDLGGVIEDAAVSHFGLNPDLMFEEAECTVGELFHVEWPTQGASGLGIDEIQEQHLPSQDEPKSRKSCDF